ncbi:hypothetical protein AB0F07_22585 [Streptomyces fructofermentans]
MPVYQASDVLEDFEAAITKPREQTRRPAADDDLAALSVTRGTSGWK